MYAYGVRRICVQRKPVKPNIGERFENGPPETNHHDYHEERERLTRERIIAAALRVMDTEGLEAVSMRRIAREVGVEAMSLYHHVRDKDDLLDGICEA